MAAGSWRAHPCLMVRVLLVVATVRVAVTEGHDGGVHPKLDRDAARCDPGSIEAWFRSVDRSYRALLARVDVTTAPGAEEVREFELQVTDDREWAAGYLAGWADADEVRDGRPLQGPGVSWFGDGWSASRTRQAAYDLGVADGTR